MKGLLFLLFIGIANGLQSDLEYQYKYFGSISTGIPQLSPQAAGIGIKGDITIQVQKDARARIQFTNIEIAEFNDNLGCDSRGDIPTEFRKIKDENLKKLIETPFEASLLDDDVALRVPENDLLWLTNMRKGIVSFVHNEVIKGNFHTEEQDAISNIINSGKIFREFKVLEETIHGKCTVEYTLNKLPGHLNKLKNHYIEEVITEDVQHDDVTHPSSKGSVKTTKARTEKEHQTLKHDLWHLSRSVNFDHCDENVALQITPVGITKSLSENQYEWLRSRSSHGDYLLRGSAGAFRIEMAAIEGATTLAPLGIKSEHLEATSNQTLKLVAVREPQQLLELPAKTKEVKTWMEEVLSFADKPKINKVYPWVQYTGAGPTMRYIQAFGATPFSSDDVKALKNLVTTQVQAAADLLADLDQHHENQPGEIITHLESATYHAKYLTKEDFLDLFHEFQKKDVHSNQVVAASLVFDVAASTGTNDAIQAILAAIKEGIVPIPKIFTVFISLGSNFESPTPMPELTEYVMSINRKENPFLAATAYMNFGHLIHQMCGDPEATFINYPGALFGDHTCRIDGLKEKFMPFLDNIIRNPEFEHWEKDMAIVTAGEVGVPFIVPFLRPVILGELDLPHYERILAIYALENSKLYKYSDSNLRTEIISMLTEVYSNVGEDYRVRIAALTSLLHWDPDANFWHRLARFTWREPNRQMAAYVTTLIEAVADAQGERFRKMSQAATHAVKFAKPVAPSCRKNSKYSSLVVDNRSYQGGRTTFLNIFEFLEDSENPANIDLYVLFMMNVGGFDLANLEFYFDTYIPPEFEDKLKAMLHGEKEHHNEETEATKVAKEYFNKIQENIGAQTNSKEGVFKSNLFLKIFENLQLYLPLNKATLQQLPLADKNNIAKLLVQLSLGYDLTLTKYLNPINLKSFHATDLGLPVFSTISSPMVLASTSFTTAGVGGKEFADLGNIFKKMELTAEGLDKFASKISSSLAVFVPWTNTFVETELAAQREITLPLTTTLRKEEKKEAGTVKTTHIGLAPYYKKKFNVLHADSSPYTRIIPIVNLPQFPKVNSKIVSTHPINEDDLKHIDIPQTYSGLKFNVHWESHKPFPINWVKIFNFIRKHPYQPERKTPVLLYALSTPTVRPWKLQLEFDPEASDTKNVSVSITSGSYGKKEGFAYEEENEEGIQNDQKVNKLFKNIDDDSAESGESKEVIHAEFGDSPTQRSEKLQENFGGPVDSISVKVDFEGKKHRSYELLYTWSKSYTETRKLRKSQLAFFRGPVPGKDEKPLSVCLDIQKSKPTFSPLDTIESLKTTDVDTTFIAEVTVGCTGHPTATIKGSYHLSEKAKEILKEEIENACDYDPYDPLITLRKHAVYNEIKYSIGWEKVCDAARIPILTRITNVLDALSSRNPITCNLENEPSRKITVNLERCPETHHWDIKGKRDDHEFSVQIPRFDGFFDDFFAVKRRHSSEHKYPHHYTTAGTESPICSLGTNSIRTFDGFTHNYTLTNCWTVAAKDCSSDTGAILLIRAPQGDSKLPELRYISENQQFVVDVAGDVKVNGKVISPTPTGKPEIVKDEQGHFLCKVYKKNNYLMVKFDKFYAFAIKERVEVAVPKSIHGNVCGLCGNFNGELKDELVGPHKCYYGCFNSFLASWTAVEDSCTNEELTTTKEKVKKHQEHCETITASLNAYQNYSNFCTNYGWLVKSIKPDEICLSTHPIPHCTAENCKPASHTHEQVHFRCWPKDKTPSSIKASFDKGEAFTSFDIQLTGYTDEVDYHEVPSSCRTL